MSPFLHIPPNTDSRLHRPNRPRRLLGHDTSTHRSRPRHRRRGRSALSLPPEEPPQPIGSRPNRNPSKPRRGRHTKNQPHRQERLRNRIRSREPIPRISKTNPQTIPPTSSAPPSPVPDPREVLFSKLTQPQPSRPLPPFPTTSPPTPSTHHSPPPPPTPSAGTNSQTSPPHH